MVLPRSARGRVVHRSGRRAAAGRRWSAGGALSPPWRDWPIGALGGLEALIISLELGIADDRLDEGPAQPFVTLLGDPAVPGLAARGIGRGHQPSVGGELTGRTEAANVVDLGINQPGEELADARQAFLIFL